MGFPTPLGDAVIGGADDIAWRMRLQQIARNSADQTLHSQGQVRGVGPIAPTVPLGEVKGAPDPVPAGPSMITIPGLGTFPEARMNAGDRIIASIQQNTTPLGTVPILPGGPTNPMSGSLPTPAGFANRQQYLSSPNYLADRDTQLLGQSQAASLQQRTPGNPLYDPLAAARAASEQALSILPRRSTYGYAGLNPNEISSEHLPHAAAIQQEIYRNLLPSDMQTRLGFGRLNLDTTKELGGNGIMGNMQLNQNREMGYVAPTGTFVPGTNQTAAQRAATEHSPEGLEAQRRQQLLMKLTDQGASQERIQQTLGSLPSMSGGGPPIPNYLGGVVGFGGLGGNAGVPSQGTPRQGTPIGNGLINYGDAREYARTHDERGNAIPGPPLVAETGIAPRINRVMDRAIQDFQGPANAHGHRAAAQVPGYAGNEAAIHNAITNYFAGFTNSELRNNYEAIAERASKEFGANAMNGWQSTNFWSGSAGGPHQTQRNRVVRAQGRTPHAGHLENFWGNMPSFTNPLAFVPPQFR